MGLGFDPRAPGEVGLLPPLYTDSVESFLRASGDLSPLAFGDSAEPGPEPELYDSLELLVLGGGGGGTFFPLSDTLEESSFSEGNGLFGRGILLKAERDRVGDTAW